jgi:DNA (cytosine-5)-methyltransferase 1
LAIHAAIQALDFCCGGGAFSFGLQMNPIKVIGGIDNEKKCVYPYQFNNNAPLWLVDAKQLTKNDFEGFNKLTGPRLLVGSPPCQTFSAMGQLRGKKHIDWTLVAKFADIIKWTIPDVVAMENVSGLANHFVFQKLLRTLDSLGYTYHYYKAFDCQNIGVPQTRKRLILLANNRGAIIPLKNTVWQSKTLRETIGDLPVINAGEICQTDSLHRAPKLTELSLARVKAARPGGSWKDLPDHLKPDRLKTEKKITHNGFYGRLSWDLPSPTLLTQFYNVGVGRYTHPDQHRGLSLREGARIQTFPDSFRFVEHDSEITFESIGKLIGNAVPVLLARAIGEAVFEYCKTVGI